MPIRKYNWVELKLEYIKNKGYKNLKEFIKDKIWEEAFKKNGNYKTHIRENIKTWNKEKESFWRDFIRDTKNLLQTKDYISFYLAIKQLIDLFPKMINSYIEQKEKEIKEGKAPSIDELLKLQEFLAPYLGMPLLNNWKKYKLKKKKANLEIFHKVVNMEKNIKTLI